MSKLTCIKLTEAWNDRYDDFVSKHESSMFFHTNKYKRLLNTILGVEDNYLLAIDENQVIQAILPLMYKKGILGTVVNSLPFYGSNGAILSNSDLAFDFLKEYYDNNIAGNIEIAASTVISNPLITNHNYENIKHEIKDHRIGQFTKIGFSENHEEQLMNLFHYKTRNMVRKSQKQNLEVVVDNSQIDFLFDTHKKNMAAIGGRAKIEIFFRTFSEIYKENEDYKIYVAKDNGVPIAALLLFYHNQTVEYYSPVIIEEHREKQPLSLLIFEAMKNASEGGYKLWNWGGTWASQDGVYRFKKRWGTDDINYYYYTQINNKDILNASKETLLKEYPDVFVLPFQHLVSN